MAFYRCCFVIIWDTRNLKGAPYRIGKFTKTRRELGAQYSRLKTVRTQINFFDWLQTCSHGPDKFSDMTFKFQMFSNDILNVYK